MTIYKESKTIFLLSLPLIIGQVGQMLLGLVDSVMVAKLGVTELAALTLANNLFFVPFIFGIGIMTCVSIRVSTAKGAGNAAEVRSVCRNSTYLALMIGTAFFLLAWVGNGLIEHMKQDPIVASRSRGYFIIICASLIPGLVAISLKNHVDALDRMWTAFTISIAAVILNVFLNWVLIYGNLGAPAMGLEGAGYATLISRTILVLAMLVWFAKDASLAKWTPYRWFTRLDTREIKSLLRLGFPAGLQTLTEVGAFVMSGIILGWISKEALAAQQIALVCAGIAFMIPLGISIALTIRVAEKVGRNQTSNLHAIYLSGWSLTLVFSILTGMSFLLFGGQMAQQFIDDAPLVIAYATSFLMVAGVFQIVDGQQVASIGMLRGLHDTTKPAVIGFFSYWIIGIPFGYWLAFHTNVGAVGIWWGLALGLTIASILLGVRLWRFQVK
ncbi:MAG: MATE family efflux transporter [Rubritalea sp.]|jgi:MATE family multidrug resistance protein|tara:strand:- start:14423 stop:15748 length:1326 start_codon:yes stop_codon:yes gene_type:complete